MKTKINQNSGFRKLKILLFLFSIFWQSEVLFAQSSGVQFFWDKQVGCQEYFNEESHEIKEPIFIEQISDGICIRVCEKSTVTYTLSGALGATPNTLWTVVGGTIDSQDDATCTVIWDTVGLGSIGFTVSTPNGTIVKSLCIEKIVVPLSNFIMLAYNGSNDTRSYYACTNQIINFTNLSSPNNGSAVVTYLWDFGDDTYSSAFEPTHTYLEDGEYWVVLTVFNSCNCSTSVKKRITIKSKGFEIICPGVVCEGQSATYSLPFDGKELCTEINQSNWTVDGGVITNATIHGEVTVSWDHVGPSGFGFLTFTPNDCHLACLLPTTIKIPVIQHHGTITGDSTVCAKEQARYKLPQWPTTAFNWYVLGNEDGSLAEVIQTDQRNEVIVKPLVADNIVLRCDYQNTLLHCGGSAEFTITSRSVITIAGPGSVCIGGTSTYATLGGEAVDWTLKRNSTVVATLANSNSFSYAFAIAGPYVLSIVSTSSCIGAPYNINVVTPPAAPVITGTAVICPDAPYTYLVTSPNSSSVYHWSVTDGTPITSLTGNQLIASFNNNVTHTVTVYEERQVPFVCASVPNTFNVTKLVIPVVIEGTAMVCANTNSSYQASSTVTNADYEDGDTYIWSLSNPSLGSITSGQGMDGVNVLWNNVSTPTNVTLQLTVRKCTVETPFTKQITITPVPELTISSDPTVCSGAPITFTASAPGYTFPAGTMVTWNAGGVITTTTGNTLTTTFYSSNTGNITKAVSASYIDPTCNVTVTVPIINVTILPGPGASNSLNVGSNNTFCTVTEIIAAAPLLTAASNVTASIQWYHVVGGVETLINGETLTNYSPIDFGGYYFTATLNGCISKSNVIQIYENCGVPPSCTLDPAIVVTNDSYNDCGILHLQGTSTVTPNSSFFMIYGPGVSLNNYTGSTLTVGAGVYQTFYMANFPCLENGLLFAALQKREDVVVPYIPSFNYTRECDGNNTFTIKVFNTTDVLGGVTATFTYFYRLQTAGGTNPWVSVTVNPDDSLNYTFPQGVYEIKLEVNGSYGGSPMDACSIIESNIILQTLPSNLAIDITTPPTCHDTAVGFQIIGSLPSYTQLWTFDAGAENTLATPKRVFNESGQQQVTVTVTNTSGCSVTLGETPPFYIAVPPKCFNGDVVSDPADAKVCAGGVVTLSYGAGVTPECGIDHYQWMNGNVPIAGATSATYTATNATVEGFYWLKVYSIDNCVLETSSRITPVFKPLPTVSLSSAGTFCGGSIIPITAVTSATVVHWTRDGVVEPNSAGKIDIEFYSLPVGTYQIGIEVIQDGCTAFASHTITVVPSPDVPELAYEVTGCAPYQAVITVTNAQATGMYNWSNGGNGSFITVTHGGPYQVTFSTGSCSSSNQLVVPKNAQEYIWIFPLGCVSSCDKTNGTLIGPRLPLSSWGWFENLLPDSTGNDSFTDPYWLQNSGSYSLQLQTVPNSQPYLCTLTSASLEYTLLDCKPCDIKELKVKDQIKNDTKFCSFTVTFTIDNGGDLLTTTIGTVSDDVIITPSVVTLYPGPNTITVIIIPINGFTGGLLNLFFNSITKDGKSCMNEIQFTLLPCDGEESMEFKTDSTANNTIRTITLSPNPAKEEVTLLYSGLEDKNTVELYDLTGRNLVNYSIDTSDGSLLIPINNYPSGIYIVLIRSKNGIVGQRKLIIE